MNCKTKALLFFLTFSICVAAQIPAATVPQFSFVKPDKSTFTDKDLARGKMLFFIFFDADCDHCHHAIQYIDQHYTEFKKAAIYLISLDNKEKVAGVLTRYGPGLLKKRAVTILQDANNEFILKFKPRKYPSIFLYSEKKVLLLYDDDEQNLPMFSQSIKAGQ